MGERIIIEGLQVDGGLKAFVETEALPGTGISAERFWAGLAGLVADFAPENRGSSPSATTCRRRSTPGTASGRAGRSTSAPTAPS